MVQALRVVAAVVLLASSSALADGLGDIEVEEVWDDESLPVTYVLVSYENTTRRTFKRMVTIECTALDEEKRKIDLNSRSFYARELGGGIRPGFKRSLKIPIETHGRAHSAGCNIIAAL